MMAPTRSMLLLLTYAPLAAAMLQQPSEARVQAVKAPSVPHLAGDQEAEAVAATSSPASPFNGVLVFMPPLPPLPTWFARVTAVARLLRHGRRGRAIVTFAASTAGQLLGGAGACGNLRALPHGLQRTRAAWNVLRRLPIARCSSARICLSHAIMGNLSTFAGGTIDQLRLFVLPLTCNTFVLPELTLKCFRELLLLCF
ncbi:hypothetical protein D1007_29772 [Hordeum vulgare]|nr:hypothetical protein D1007_29772 [Hordeum vulgare]